jgi:hypothetical protein
MTAGRDCRTAHVLSRQEEVVNPETVNLDQLFLDDLCHSCWSRSFDEGYGKTRMFAVRW